MTEAISWKQGDYFVVRSCLVPMLQRVNPYGMHSHAGAWEREKVVVRLRRGIDFYGLVISSGRNKVNKVVW